MILRAAPPSADNISVCMLTTVTVNQQQCRLTSVLGSSALWIGADEDLTTTKVTVIITTATAYFGGEDFIDRKRQQSGVGANALHLQFEIIKPQRAQAPGDARGNSTMLPSHPFGAKYFSSKFATYCVLGC